MMKHKRKGKRLLSLLLSALMATAVVPAVPSLYSSAIIYPDGMECVLITENNACFNVEQAVVNGSVYAHDGVQFYGSETARVSGFVSSYGSVDGNITAAQSTSRSYVIPDLSDNIAHHADYQQRFDGDTVIAETALDISGGIYTAGNLKLDEVTLSGQGYITAGDSIRCHPVQTDDTAIGWTVLYAENGDIIISGSKLTINGIIYAPHGKVVFNVKHLTINGSVYAQDVTFNGTTLNLNRAEQYDTLVTDLLTVEAGPDREIYVGESLLLEGNANYDEGVSYYWSGDDSISFDKANTAQTLAVFSKVGTYTVTLNGTLRQLSDSDTLTVKVHPDPAKVFTTTSDFAGGTADGTQAQQDALILDTEQHTAKPIRQQYLSPGVSGINIDSTVSKNKITASSDALNITYNLTGTGSTASAEEQGVDFAFVIDISGSMSGVYLSNAQEAARTILGYMREGDRFAITDLGKVHIGFTDDKEVLETEIDHINMGYGSSEPDDGIRIATALFDEESSDNRQKYIILLADGEAYDGDYSMESMKQSAQDAADRGIRIFSLAMRNDIQNMQEAAIITKGIYKNCPDGPTIKTFMEKFGEQIFTSAARNAIFKTTVADAGKVDWENIAPAPSSVNKNEDGSADLVWNLNDLAIDQTEQICIPIQSDHFAESGYERLSYNTALYYNDKEGKGQKTYLDDIALPCEHYQVSGIWSSVYDSGRENCEWTGIYWNGRYPADSRVNVYISVSNNGTDYTEEQQVLNYTVPDGVRGRYIRIRTELIKGADGSTPVIEDITVISGTMRLSAPIDYAIHSAADLNGSVFANRPITLYADIQSTTDSVKTITWTIDGTEKYTLDTTNPLMPVITFGEPGTYRVTLHAADDGGRYAESTFSVEVREEENIEAIIFDDGVSTAPVKYTVEGASPVYSSAYAGTTLRLITNDPSAISWFSVRFIPSEPRYINRWNEVYVYHVSEDLTCQFRMPYYNAAGTLEIVAYDWSGKPYPYSIETAIDDTRPTVAILPPESPYPNGRFYTGDPYTITVSASDNTAIDHVTLLLNNEEVTLDEKNSYTFTPEEANHYYFTATATDTAGNTAITYYTLSVAEDTAAPFFNPCALNRTYASIGNEIVFTAQAEDRETGLRSVAYTLNDAPITLDENGEYHYIVDEAGTFVFKATAEDNRGNIGETTRTLTVTEDTQRPSVSIEATRRGEILVGTSAVVTVKSSDNVAVTKTEVDVNGKSRRLNEDGQFTLKASEAGDIVITATVYDKAGNTATAVYRLKAIDEDTTPPTVNFYINRQEYMDAVRTISVTSGDNTKVAKRKLYLDGKQLTAEDNGSAAPEYSYVDYYTFNPYAIGVGEHTFKAITTDASGNRAEVSQTFTVSDTYRPNISISGSYYFNTGDDVVLSMTITDASPLGSVTGTLNEQPFTLTTDKEQNLTIPHAAAGTYNYSITATDIYGNAYTVTRNLVVRDTVKPVITLSDIEEEYFIPNKPVIRMTVTDNVAVASVTAKMNGNDITYDGKQLILPEELPESTYTITVTAVDTTGNTSAETITFTVSMPKDTTPPVIETVQLVPEYPQIGAPIRVYVKASDDSGTVTVTVSTNDTLFDYADGVFTYTPQNVGEIVVIIQAADPSGNVTALSASGYVNPDTTAPTITADYLEIMTLGDSQTITIHAQDQQEVPAVTLKMNHTPVTLQNDTTYVFTPTASGEYQFVASAVDLSGNVGTKTFTVTVSAKAEEQDMTQYLINEAETALTPELRKAADQLDTAVGIYDYVKNTVSPQYYTGSRKGANATLGQLGGNDVDTASLLIAMMRYRGYPARYAGGTVQYTDEELIQLTCASDVTSAIDCINASGYDSQVYYTPDGRKLIRIAHTWAEVYVPITECGGTGSSKTWVTLDPWFKSCQLIEQETDNTDYQAQAAMSDEILARLADSKSSTAADVSALEQDLKNTINHQKTLKSAYKKIVAQKVDKLPSAADFTIVSKNKDFVKVAEEDCDTVSFRMNGSVLAELKTNELSGKRILIQYLPAEESDKTLFKQNGENWKATAASAMHVVPVITADGKILGTGSKTTLGQSQTITIQSDCNGKVRSYNDELIAGSMYAVVINLYDMSPIDIADAYNNMYNNALSDTAYGGYSEEYLGTLLDFMGKMYFALNDITEFTASATYHISQNPDIAVGLFGYEFDVTLNGWTGQVTGSLKDGMYMTDIDCLRSTPVSLNGNTQNVRDFILTTGMLSSYFEGYIWEYLTGAKGVSAVSVLLQAALCDVDLLMIDDSNRTYALSELVTSDEVRNDITHYLDLGYTIMIPQRNITINDWTGTGYMILNFDNMSESIYRLSGDINGGGSSTLINMIHVVDEKEMDEYDTVFENLVQTAYQVRVAMATLKMQYAALSFSAGVYATIGSGAGVVGDVITGAASVSQVLVFGVDIANVGPSFSNMLSGVQASSVSLFNARTLLLDYYSNKKGAGYAQLAACIKEYEQFFLEWTSSVGDIATFVGALNTLVKTEGVAGEAIGASASITSYIANIKSLFS